MIKRFAAGLCRLDEDGEIVPRPGLPDKFRQPLGAEARLQIVIIAALGRDETVRILLGFSLGFGRGHGATHSSRTVRNFDHGLKTASPGKRKSRTFRVTSVKPCTSAVAAICPSM